jgi:hypothetical protein
VQLLDSLTEKQTTESFVEALKLRAEEENLQLVPLERSNGETHTAPTALLLGLTLEQLETITLKLNSVRLVLTDEEIGDSPFLTLRLT